VASSDAEQRRRHARGGDCGVANDVGVSDVTRRVGWRAEVSRCWKEDALISPGWP
jgi:hypothetical protein